MNLIQVNNVVLNLDHVLSAEFRDGELAVQSVVKRAPLLYNGLVAKGLWKLMSKKTKGATVIT